jgi:hypothetical protein
MIGLRMTMYAIATKVTSPPRTSRENVDPLLVISKNESTRFRKVGSGADFVVSVVVTRLLYRRKRFAGYERLSCAAKLASYLV